MTSLQSQTVANRALPSRKRASYSRTLVRTLVAAAALAATAPAAFAQVVLVPVPGPVQEHVPPPRPGHMWHHGYWQWEHGRYVWISGTWVAQPTVAYGVYPAAVQPAPEPPPPPRVERLSADALFPFDRGDVNDIRPAGLSDLAQIAARLRASPFGHVEVRGYTDRLGSDAYNLDLSRRRAEAVKAVLVQQGVPAQKIRADGLGSQDPVTQCGNMDNADLVRCLQPDRRVEIVTYVRD
ncbi:OmpA family protein [Paraburkholderia phenazinium]|jgi:OOP family OmpA-OmpF porin|uniref:OmpA-OmpF porin, OOP family n=1 Tax=Paraburkholderia phenazinium TaxID=60549 RepID=A0A1G7Q8A6_9BURK|nr:OmpA family protein [Paraburkholderia phenazinium]SDF94724.1 OmpA-OmpF porin, OOP family [Paraburkholderia phenazinium]